MSTRYTTEEIRRKYDEQADKYISAERPQEILGMRRLRRRLLRRASGEALEVAVGSGVNLPHYPSGTDVTATDISTAMLEKAQRTANSLGYEVGFRLMDAEALEFPDESFDTVVSTLTLCTFPDPLAALGEMKRVCKRDGRILLLEHGRSDEDGWRATRTAKRRLTPSTSAATGTGTRSTSWSSPG